VAAALNGKPAPRGGLNRVHRRATWYGLVTSMRWTVAAKAHIDAGYVSRSFISARVLALM
jgi:hypothetical protein